MVVYYHADGDPSAQGSLRMLTLSNVGQDDWRLWLCLAGMYVVSLLLVKLVSEEVMVYVRTRHRYFHQPRAQDYSCIVKVRRTARQTPRATAARAVPACTLR